MERYWFMSFIVFILLHDSIFAQRIPCSRNALSATCHHLREVDINYNHDFPYRDSYSNQKVTQCVKAYRTVIANRTMGSKYTAVKKNMPVLRCREHIRLLRPIKIINQWLYIQSKKHFFPLTIREFNIINIPAHITAVHACYKDVVHRFSRSYKTRRVIGTFERHEINIQTYTFKNINTGKMISINATPYHPVYVKNKSSFISINSLSSIDELLNNTGQRIKLVCSADHTGHCGIPLNYMVPTPVYNLEIEKKHTYFVSSIKLLVHNNCQLAEKLKSMIPDLVKLITIPDGQNIFLELANHDDIQRAYSALRKLEGNNIQSDTLAILTVAYLQKEPIHVSSLESFIQLRSTYSTEDYDRVLSNFIYGKKNPDFNNKYGLEKILSASREKMIVVFTDKKAAVVIYPNKGKAPTVHMLIGEQLEQQPIVSEQSNKEILESVFNDTAYGHPVKYFTTLNESQRSCIHTASDLSDSLF